MPRLNHAVMIVAEIVGVSLLVWVCSATLRPDAVRIVNDLGGNVSLVNCEYAIGVSGPVEIEPGETRTVYATRACQVHAPSYVGCLAIPREAYAARATLNVSSLDRIVRAEVCAETRLRQEPRNDPFDQR